MLKKKFAAAVAAMMTISSLSTVAFAEVTAGLTYDKLLGNELVEGTFEHGVNVGADRWVQKANVSFVMDNTHNGSAGAILVDQSASKVYSGFSMRSNRIHHAQAYIKLYEGATDKAKLVLATKSGDTFTPITSTAVQTDVNGTGWTKLEGDFIRSSASADSANVYCYIELENETKFYLDDVIIKDINCSFPAGTEVVVLTDENNEKCVAGKLVAGADGTVYAEQKPSFLPKTDYVLTAWTMLDKDSETETVKAYMKYAKGFGMATSEKVNLAAGEKTEIVIEAKLNAGSVETTKKVGVGIEGATEGDIVYYGLNYKVKEDATPVPAAEITIDSFDALSGGNTITTLSPDANTVALRYFYSVKNENSDTWTFLKTGHTVSGDTAVPSLRLDSRYIGKTVKLEVQPMNADLVYGAKASATTTVRAPFEAGVITPAVDEAAGKVTASFDVTNTSGGLKSVAALVAYYNSKDEMIGIGIQNKPIADRATESFDVTVEVVPETGDYSKLYLLDGTTTSSALALFPIAEAK